MRKKKAKNTKGRIWIGGLKTKKAMENKGINEGAETPIGEKMKVKKHTYD